MAKPPVKNPGDTILSSEWNQGWDWVEGHIDDVSNPHQVTPVQIGAATQAALDAHEADTNNPHQVTAAQVGAAPTIITGTGTCWRFPDGMQICWYYGLYVNGGGSATWTYPAAFSSAPTVVPAGHRALMNNYVDPQGTTSATIYNTSSTGRNAHIIAVGNWT